MYVHKQVLIKVQVTLTLHLYNENHGALLLGLPRLVNRDFGYSCVSDRAEIENLFTRIIAHIMPLQGVFHRKTLTDIVISEWYFLGTDMFQLHSLPVLISIVWCIKYWIYF